MYENADPKTLKHVGSVEPRSEGIQKVTGQAVYASDMIMPGMLYAQVKKSPHARAKIRGIDVSKAHLDVATRPDGREFRLPNTPEGIADLVARHHDR